MISVSKATEIIRQHTSKLETEKTNLGNVCHRVLAENILADMDLPPFDRSQMDGFAVKASDTKNVPVKLKIVGESAAGKSWRNELKKGECVRIMTGAMVPKGADSVQKVEDTREENGIVKILESTTAEQHIVRQASEIKKGATVFQTGETVSAAMIAALASFGYARIKVGRRPRVAILATGNELVEVNKRPLPDQIRDSNSATLEVYARKCNALTTLLPTSGDNLEHLKVRISNAVQNYDVLILSGGVSVGKYDFTKTALRELGAEIYFEKVALRPGKPTVFAKIGGCSIFGLPGNPVSVVVTFNLFVRAALLQMQGANEVNLTAGVATLTQKLKGVSERDSYLPAKLSADKNGQMLIEPVKWGGSSDFVSFARCNSLVFVPQSKTLETNSIAKFLLLP